jgi:predicted PurR-regulated permease PerM
VIPCLGVVAIVPGIIAIVLASIGLSQAARRNEPRGLLIAGLIIGIIALLIGFSQVFVAGKIASKADKWPNDIQNIINDVQDNVIKDLEDANVSIKVESNGEKVEINVDRKEKVEQLEELEGVNTQSEDTLTPKK